MSLKPRPAAHGIEKRQGQERTKKDVTSPINGRFIKVKFNAKFFSKTTIYDHAHLAPKMTMANGHGGFWG